ncbi:thiopeptide-type bacteriocin biosynthesis protein [Kitasatospora hibisci]|uniref:lantibiotic dehydratase n=1 Tax=Kitasatospora hibisci TaxID=3369522 RepID=UPI003754F278
MLSFTANCQAMRRGDSVVLLRRAEGGTGPAREVAIAATETVDLILGFAQEAVPEDAMVRRMLEMLPAATPDMCRGFIRRLHSLGFLLAAEIGPSPLETVPQKWPGLNTATTDEFAEEVRSEAKEALELLRHLLPPVVPDAEKRLHQRFVEAYGVDSAVPLPDVLDDHRGLGIPDRHLTEEPPVPDTSLPSGAGEAVLASLLHESLAEGRREVLLNAEHAADVMSSGVPADTRIDLPCSVSVSPLGLRADSGPDPLLLEPEFGTSSGWRHITPQTLADRETAVLVPVAAPRTAAAPLHGRRIVVDIAPTLPGDLPLTAIGLRADAHRLHVVDLEHGTVLIPVAADDTPESALPPVARLLLALGRLTTGGPLAWSWGALSAQPFLPRVRYRRTVLTPARWRVPVRLTAAAAEAGPAWATYRDAWQAGYHVPDLVRIPDPASGGRRRLEVAVRSDEFRELIASGKHGYVLEPVGDAGPAEASRSPHVHFPVGAPSTYGEQRHRVLPPIPRPVRRFTPSRHLPGGEWLYAKIPCPQRSQPLVLLRIHDRLATVLTDAVDRWFFVRYLDQGSGQLRLRLHGQPEPLLTQVVPVLRDTVAELHRAGLTGAMSLDTYDQEVDRYGGAALIADAERLFAEDSRSVLDLWCRHGVAGPSLDNAVEGVLDLLHAFDPTLRSASWMGRVSGALTEGGPRLQADRATEARTRRPAAQRFGRLLRKPDEFDPTRLARINESLVHMHCNRLFGVDPEAELRLTNAVHRRLRQVPKTA